MSKIYCNCFPRFLLYVQNLTFINDLKWGILKNYNSVRGTSKLNE